jgi:hypothetical protein
MSFDINAGTWQLLPFGFQEASGNSNEGTGNSEDDSSQNQGAQGNSGDQNANSSGSGNDDGSTDDDEYEGLSAKELRRIARDNAKRAEQAEKDAATAKSTLTAKEREKLDKEQRQELEINDLKNEVAKLRSTNTKLALIGAIRDDKRYEWHNPEMVAAQLDSEKVKVSDDGKVEGLAPALTKIAKDDSLKFMLKTDNTQQSNNQQQQQNNGQQTGLQPGQGGANQGGSLPPNASELAELMPALRNRM